jgi:hypothetical protein
MQALRAAIPEARMWYRASVTRLLCPANDVEVQRDGLGLLAL